MNVAPLLACSPAWKVGRGKSCKVKSGIGMGLERAGHKRQGGRRVGHTKCGGRESGTGDRTWEMGMGMGHGVGAWEV